MTATAVLWAFDAIRSMLNGFDTTAMIESMLCALTVALLVRK